MKWLGEFVARFWHIVLGAWVVLLVAGWRLAPDWDTVSESGDLAFLPETTPSRQGEELCKQAFPDGYAGSSAVLVISPKQSDRELTEADRAIIKRQLVPTLRKHLTAQDDGEAHADDQALVSQVVQIRTPDDPGTGTLLMSRDKKAALVVVELKGRFQDRRNWPVIDRLESLVKDFWNHKKSNPTGLQIALTGSATVGRDTGAAERKSIHDIEVWTIIVVLVLLLLTFRAPLVALMPLVMVYVAVQLSINVLSLLGQAHVLVLSREMRIFITILAYGAGVDYCVFLMDRYREELQRGLAVGEAVTAAVGRAGVAIIGSAATVICGIAMLAFAQFGKVHQAGLTIPLALVLVLTATLTLAPALLCMWGRWLFWPQNIAASDRQPTGAIGRFFRTLLHGHVSVNLWQRIGPLLARRPALIWCTTVAILAPFAVFAIFHYRDVTYDPLGGLPDSAPSSAGARVLEQHFAPGLLGPVTYLIQDGSTDFRGDEGGGAVKELTDKLASQKDELGIADIRSAARPLGITDAAKEAIERLGVSGSIAEEEVHKRALEHYVSHSGDASSHVTRVDVILTESPFATSIVARLDEIDKAIRSDLRERLPDAEVSLTGTPATVRDLRAVTASDQMRVQEIIPPVLFALLFLIFRRAGVSLYLVASVVFSYLATLGATVIVFKVIEGNAFSGLDWKVPLFLFTILVAVGEDYNIFLLSRVYEESKSHGAVDGITKALARTGRIISTCGFIMAGTFASLFAGSFLALKELGFALCTGVLLDTLVVRPILVPTFLLIVANKVTAKNPK